MERRTDIGGRESKPDDNYLAFCFPLLAQDIHSPRAIKFFAIEKGEGCGETVSKGIIYLPSLAEVLKSGKPMRGESVGNEVSTNRQSAVGDTTGRRPD